MADISDSGSFNLGLANIAASNYGPNATTAQGLQGAQTQLTAANTQNTQQEAIARSQQNQLLAARMPLILSGIHDESVGAGDQSGVGGDESAGAGAGAPASMSEHLQKARENSGAADDSILKPELIDQAYRSKYFVPQYTPQEMQALRKSYMVDPKDEYGMGPKRVMTAIEMRKAQQTQESQMGSRDDFDALHAVTDAPEGQAMSVLEASHPETVAAIRRQFKNDPNEERDEEDQARLFAAHAAGAVHQYTGRKAVKDESGTYRDEETGMPIPGVDKVGLSTDQYVKLAHEAITPSVEMDDGNGGKIKVAPWKAAQMGGAKNINGPGDWMMVRASQTNLPGAASTLSGNSAQKQEARKVAQAALDKVQKQHDDATPTDGAPKAANGVGTARNAQGNIDPKLTDALHDDKYDYKPTNNGEPYTPAIGHSPPPTVAEDMKNQTTARNSLAKDSNQGVGAASAALTMYKAAQDVLAKGNYDPGAWNAELAKYSKWLPAGWQNHMTGDYQEVAKYLGNAALQSGKGIFQKMTQMEAKMLLTELSPSPSMDPNAARDMIAKGAKIAQYTVDSAKRVPAYLHAGKDANQFNSWNQEHFPMETETKVTPAKPNTGVTAPKFSDAQVSAYMQKHGLKDEQATRKALGL
jgi:hypothetical protein